MSGLARRFADHGHPHSQQKTLPPECFLGLERPGNTETAPGWVVLRPLQGKVATGYRAPAHNLTQNSCRLVTYAQKKKPGGDDQASCVSDAALGWGVPG
jgi:hypothetical protein